MDFERIQAHSKEIERILLTIMVQKCTLLVVKCLVIAQVRVLRSALSELTTVISDRRTDKVSGEGRFAPRMVFYYFIFKVT